MELETCLAILAGLVALVTSGVVPSVHVREDGSLHKNLIERMDTIHRQLADVTKTMRTLDTDIGKALVPCLTGGDPLCKALVGDSEPHTLSDANSFWNTEKRAATENSVLGKQNRYYRELLRKQAMVNHLLATFRGADDVLTHERKRTCQLNLGFHCETEELSDFANVYDFLSSENSPGKKRSVKGVF